MKGMFAADIAPLVLKVVRTHCINKRTVHDALLDHRWVEDNRGNLSAQGLVQCLNLLMTVCSIYRDASVPDQFVWPWSTSGCYIARMLMHGPTRMA
jgi:hypothetical protein